MPDIYEVAKYDLLIRSYFRPYDVPNSNPDESKEYYTGNVKITFKLVKTPVNFLLFHAHPSLKIGDTIRLRGLDDATDLTIPKGSHDYAKNQLYRANLTRTIDINKNYVLDIDFVGTYGYSSRSLSGFYISKYTEGNQLK